MLIRLCSEAFDKTTPFASYSLHFKQDQARNTREERHRWKLDVKPVGYSTIMIKAKH